LQNLKICTSKNESNSLSIKGFYYDGTYLYNKRFISLLKLSTSIMHKLKEEIIDLCIYIELLIPQIIFLMTRSEEMFKSLLHNQYRYSI